MKWEYSKYRTSIRDTETGELIGLFHDGNGMAVKPKHGRLIAAAPELLEACKECAEVVEAAIEDFRGSISEASRAGLKARLRKAQEAMAKAEGKQ